MKKQPIISWLLRLLNKRTKFSFPKHKKKKIDFIVEQNHQNGYEIKETEYALEAWGYTNEEKLEQAKEAKYNEALQGAKDYIDNEAVYQFDENNSIEATDGNIGKMTANAVGLAQGAIETVTWTSKEDNVLILNAEDVARILLGLGAVQAAIWNVKFVAYKNEIEQAETIEEVEAIVIDYGV